MYCIKCFKQNKKETADYIFKGNSICTEHLSEKLKPGSKVTPLLTNNSNRRARVKLQSKP